VFFVIPDIPFCEVQAAGGGLLIEGVMVFFIVFQRVGGLSSSYYATNCEVGVSCCVANSRVSAAY
jgi:hypothetical protein